MKNSFKNNFSARKKKHLSLAGVSENGKINFYEPKNQFPRAEIKFPLKCCYPEKRFLLGAMKFLCKVWLSYIISIMVTTSKKNTIILKNSISPRQKRILQLLFLLVETIIDISKNQII